MIVDFITDAFLKLWARDVILSIYTIFNVFMPFLIIGSIISVVCFVLKKSDGEADDFYGRLAKRSMMVCVPMLLISIIFLIIAPSRQSIDIVRESALNDFKDVILLDEEKAKEARVLMKDYIMNKIKELPNEKEGGTDE